MILTDRFVYIHLPGTGGTFVTRAIEQVYRTRVAAGSSPRPVNTNKHGTCREIPESHRHLPIVSNIRNPLDRYVASYEYAWWRKHEMPGIARRDILRIYPHYPDISFAEFVELTSAHFNEIKTPHLSARDQPGYLTEVFARFFFRDPEAVLAGFGRPYFESRRYREDMYDVHFLRTDRLNDDMGELLESAGFAPDEVKTVRSLGRVSPPRVRLGMLDLLLRYKPRRTVRDWRKYYTPRLAELVREREWFLFSLFPELDAQGS